MNEDVLDKWIAYLDRRVDDEGATLHRYRVTRHTLDTLYQWKLDFERWHECKLRILTDLETGKVWTARIG